LPGTYDPRLIALSIVIASSASYTAFTLAERVTASQARARLLWLIGGATTMGTGIWSMHFTGMLAFQLPIPVSYSLPIVLLSLLVAIAASGIALAVVSQPNLSIRLWLLGGLLLGAGVGTMHYIGMAAMRMNAMAHWDPRIVALSLVIAVAVSLVALWLVFHLRSVTTLRGARQRGIAAGFMGVAIAGMHYTGMAAASFTSMPMPVGGPAVVSAAALGSGAIALVTVLILSLALGIAFIDRRFAAQERALTESRQRFRTVVANAPVSLLAIDAAGTITLAQGRGLAALGHTSDDMVGCSLFEVFAGVPELVQLGHRALAGEELLGFSSVRDLVLETLWTPEVDALGQVTGVIAVATDVTARHRAEIALHASEERFRMLVQHTSDITMVADPAGMITYISPSVETTLGYTPTDLLGRPVHTLLHQEDLPLLEEFRAGIPDAGEAHLITERRLRHRDGTWRYVEAITTNLLHVPSVEGVVINARDITERKAFEQQLRGDGECRNDGGHAASTQSTGRSARDRRFRDRLLQSRVSETIPRRLAQDRSRLRLRPPGRERGCLDHSCGGQPWPCAQPLGGGRGGRNSRRGGPCGGTGL
jgi:PAS domain S-box-containing protein